MMMIMLKLLAKLYKLQINQIHFLKNVSIFALKEIFSYINVIAFFIVT